MKFLRPKVSQASFLQCPVLKVREPQFLKSTHPVFLSAACKLPKMLNGNAPGFGVLAEPLIQSFLPQSEFSSARIHCDIRGILRSLRNVCNTHGPKILVLLLRSLAAASPARFAKQLRSTKVFRSAILRKFLY